jgi:hypothetical protein
MTPEEDDQNKLQVELDQKIANQEPYACIRIFEDHSVFITDEARNVIIRDSQPTGDPSTGAMDVARWYNRSPT